MPVSLAVEILYPCFSKLLREYYFWMLNFFAISDFETFFLCISSKISSFFSIYIWFALIFLSRREVKQTLTRERTRKKIETLLNVLDAGWISYSLLSTHGIYQPIKRNENICFIIPAANTSLFFPYWCRHTFCLHLLQGKKCVKSFYFSLFFLSVV